MTDLRGNVRALTFDVFGTVLDLGGSLRGPLDHFLKAKETGVTADQVWAQWRYRQRIEQYQDTLLMLGHSGYREVARRALLYVLRQFNIPFIEQEAARLMEAWQELSPFPDALGGLKQLKERFTLVVLSNGEREFLEHLVKNRIRFDFDHVLSVQDVGAFKPHPVVYRMAARVLGARYDQLLMVSANSFDVMGAKSCGYRGAWVNRYQLPFEETPYQPDLTVQDFRELADRLCA